MHSTGLGRYGDWSPGRVLGVVFSMTRDAVNPGEFWLDVLQASHLAPVVLDPTERPAARVRRDIDKLDEVFIGLGWGHCIFARIYLSLCCRSKIGSARSWPAFRFFAGKRRHACKRCPILNWLVHKVPSLLSMTMSTRYPNDIDSRYFIDAWPVRFYLLRSNTGLGT